MIERLPLQLTGGVNTFDDSVAIADGQWQRLRNIAFRGTGIPGQRPSLSFSREVIPETRFWDARLVASTPAVVGYYKWAKFLRPIRFLFDPNYGEISMLAVTTGTMSVASSVAGFISVVSVPAGKTLFINLPCVMCDFGGSVQAVQAAILGEMGQPASLFVFDGTTYAFDGLGQGYHLGPQLPFQTSGSLAGVPLTNYVANDFGSGNGDFSPAGACVVRDRVLYYKGPNIYFSDRNEPLTVGYTGSLDADGNIVPSTANPATGTNYSAIDTRGIFLGGEELENITAVAEINTSADGSPVQSVAMAFTNTHAYMLLGEPLETTEGGDVLGSLQINRLNMQAGCVSQATITRTPYGTFWCGRDDVWFMPFGSLPRRVGTNIRPLLRNQPQGLLWKLHAEYAGGYYKLSLFGSGQGPDLYSPCGMQMWLDLRNGEPKGADDAKWYGPQVFVQTDAPDALSAAGGSGGVWCMARDTRAAGDQRLYALQSFMYAASASENVWGMSLCSLDQIEGKDTCAPQANRTFWAQSTAYNVGDTMVPQPSGTSVTAPIFICTTAGTSGSGSEPDWYTLSGTGTVTDGTVTWTTQNWTGAAQIGAYSPNLRQGTNEVEFSLLSKELMLGDPMTEKLLDGSEIGYWAANRAQITHNSHAKQDSRSVVLAMLNDQVAENVLDSTTGDRVWQSAALTPAPTKRFRGKSATWECQQDAGIIITAGLNDSITITFDSADHVITLTPGYYADIFAIVDAIYAAAGGGINKRYSGCLVGFQSASNTGITIGSGSQLAVLMGYEKDSQLTATGANYAYGRESPLTKQCPDIQISGINLRYREFKRRPT